MRMNWIIKIRIMSKMMFFGSSAKAPPPLKNPYVEENKQAMLDTSELLNKPLIEGEQSLTQRVFTKLLSEPDNQYCFDCGDLDPKFVSVNNGIFLCENCASGIHRHHYGVEISFIKPIQGAESNWNHQQLRALINSGNKPMREYMEFFDLVYESVQKRYSTVAVQYYREKLKSKIEGSTFQREKPDYETGRKQASQPSTPQQVLYHELGQNNILQELLDQDQHSMSECELTLHDRYSMYLQDLERMNEMNAQSQSATVNPNLPPKQRVINEPFADLGSSISNEDFQLVVTKLNEFADSTLNFGEALLKKIEESGLNEELSRIARKSEELIATGSSQSLSFIRRTKDAIMANGGTQAKVNQIKDKAAVITGKLWGYFGSKGGAGEEQKKLQLQVEQYWYLNSHIRCPGKLDYQQ